MKNKILIFSFILIMIFTITACNKQKSDDVIKFDFLKKINMISKDYCFDIFLMKKI